MTGALANCSSQAAQAEERYRIVERNDSSAERCKAAREVADAKLQARDEEGYKNWSLTARIDCQEAELDAAADNVTNAL